MDSGNKGQLTSRVGRRVWFNAPKDVAAAGGGGSAGTVVDEVWADPEINRSPSREANPAADWGDYSFYAQLIKWDSGEHSIRLAYYRRRVGESHWRFGSQMTVNSEWTTIKQLLERTLAKDDWFRDDPPYGATAQPRHAIGNATMP